MDLELSQAERIIIANQCKILEKLFPEEAEHYAKWRDALESGYVLHYDDGAEWVNEELTADDCREVFEVLAMHEALQRAYKRLPDKSGITERDVHFDGYDGNTERQSWYAHYLIHKLGKYHHLDFTDDLNSHCTMVDVYRRMLEVWRPLRGSELTKDQIQQICDARVHPSNRAEMLANR